MTCIFSIKVDVFVKKRKKGCRIRKTQTTATRKKPEKKREKAGFTHC